MIKVQNAMEWNVENAYIYIMNTRLISSFHIYTLHGIILYYTIIGGSQDCQTLSRVSAETSFWIPPRSSN